MTRHSNTKIEIPDSLLKEMMESELSVRKLEIKYGISHSVISKRLREVYPDFKRTNETRDKKIAQSNLSSKRLAELYGLSLSAIDKIKKKAGVSLGQGRTMFKEPRTIKPKVKTELKPIVMKKKISPIAKSQFEVENEAKRKAMKAKESFDATMEKQRSEGYRFVNKVCDRGIKMRVWTNK